MIEVVLDFETASACDLKAAGAWRYSEDPTTEVLCLTFTVLPRDPARMWLPSHATDTELWDLAHDTHTTFIAHNAPFEKAIWRNIMVPQFGFPDIPNSRWHDTMAVAAMKALPLDLDRCLMVLRLPHQKDKEGSALVKSLSKFDKRGRNKNNFPTRTPQIMERIYAYCKSDVAGEVGLHKRLGHLPPSERQVWLLDQRINERGVRLDLAFVSAAQRVVTEASKPLVDEFTRLTGGVLPTQRDRIMQWVQESGVSLPNLRKETLTRILGAGEADDETDDVPTWAELDEESQDPGAYTPHLPANVRRALEIRQLVGSAAVKKLPRMLACVCEDGRARGLLQYHGAGPGLWSGRLFQPQNFPRGTLQIGGTAPEPQTVVDAVMTGDPAYVEAVLGAPAIDVIVSSLRHALVPSPGRVFVAADLAGVQARTVLALAGQHDKTALMASGADVYLDMAENIFKRKLTKKENPEERQIGKNSVLGLGFQMGARKFWDRYCTDRPFEFAEGVVQTYRREWAPKVPDLWRALEGAAVRAVHDRKPYEAYGIEYRLEDGWLSARLPSGRKIWYFNPQPCTKAMPWDETDVRLAWRSQCMKMGRWLTRDMFGGLLTENVVMGIQRDLMTAACFKLETNGFPIVLNVHDEWLTEPLEKDADVKALEQIMVDIPDWARQLQIPVSVEAWIGDRYKK